MISSRRLAREWALKILYQKDVGKVPLQEALDTALERLRLEFIQRGSRAASGSTSEQVSLETVTAHVRDTLTGLRGPFERAIATVTSRVLQDAPYWQEIRIDRLFREPASALPPHTTRRLLMRHVADAFNLTESDIATLPGLQPPRLLRAQPESAVLPAPEAGGDAFTSLLAQLTPEEHARLVRFAHQIREELPTRLDSDFRLTGLAFVRGLVHHLHDLPAALNHSDTQTYLKAQRETFNQAQVERWRRVGAIVEKQTGEWLRTAAFAARLVQGVSEQQKEIDASIAALSAGWRMERQVAVDRNILRLGGYEMLFMEGVPTAASINEAVELAKKYSTTESGRFVNGVLGALAVRVGSKLQGANAASSTSNEDAKISIDDLPDDVIDLSDDMDDVDLDAPLTAETDSAELEDEQ